MARKKARAQASLEYMVMLALSLAIFAAILYVTSNLISTSTTHIGIDSSYRAVQKIVESADFIYVHGHPSKTQINVYLPPNIENFSLVNNQGVRARLSMGRSFTDIYLLARGNITGDFSRICTPVCREGYYVMSVESTSSAPPSNGIINITVL